MIFYRYQNTKTLERNSFHYVDMNDLYDDVIHYVDIYEDTTIDNILKRFKEYGRGFELCCRENLKKEDYDYILRTIVKISLKYYTELEDFGLRNENKKKARKEIDDLMKPYPLKGIFVIPESDSFIDNTKFSISELRSNIITPLSADSAKYLAVYKGEVIKESMNYGGTLIKPTELVAVYDLFNSKDESIDNMHPFYRHIEDEEILNKAIESNRDLISCQIEASRWQGNYINGLIKTHAKELIISNILRIFKVSYKELDYYKVNNRVHRVQIKKDDKQLTFFIPEKDVTIDDFINRKTINYDCKIVRKDLQGNIVGNRVDGALNIQL